MRLRHGWLFLLMILAGVSWEIPLRAGNLAAGFRFSAYGPDYDPGPEYWARVGREMAEQFEGALPGALWIVGQLDGEGTRLNFPAEPESHLIRTSDRDNNERTLLLFDRLGGEVWLQVEPGNAPVEELIHLVLARYGHHPSVVGVGVDVEWYRSIDRPEGQAVTDAEASAWLRIARSYDRRFRLFLKHWEPSKMPPTVREGLLFVDDSQILPSLEAMVEEFAEWGRTFAPAPVAFQYGYDSDRPWWRHLEDPPKEIGERILAVTPNTAGLYWVDFTVLDLFPPEPVVGVKIYDHAGDFGELLDQWDAVGINTAFVSRDLVADSRFRDAAAEKGVPVFVIAPVFFNPDVLAERPELFAITANGQQAREEWVEFVCPSRTEYRQRRRQEIVDLVRQLEPQGLSLDFIRHFAFWERVAPDTDPTSLPNTCFCPHCLATFAATHQVEIPSQLSDTASRAEWILEHHRPAWEEWKVTLITTMIEEIVAEVRTVDPGIQINVHIVPWRRQDYDNALRRVAGQDLATIATFADYLSPMTYWFMLERPYGWVGAVVREMAEASRIPILPSVQVEAAYREDDEISVDEFWLATHAALAPPSRGVIFWSWEALSRDPEKLQLLRQALGARYR